MFVMSEFSILNDKWSFAIHSLKTYAYPKELVDRFAQAAVASARDVFLLDAALGHFFAQQVESHVQQEGRGNLDLIASHGPYDFSRPKHWKLSSNW